jgi:UDP-N-acetylmuramoyl-tripeptide--D-alanyl-D-alanine ligase
MAGNLRPDVGVYTNIGPVHIEFFGTIEKIAEAKRELLENVKDGGTIVVNNDNKYVVDISRGFTGPKVTYGIDNDADFRATNVRERGLLGTTFNLREFPMELKLPGRHNLENLLAAIATARVVGISWDGIARGIQELKPAYHRGIIIEARGATIYDDTYNSNPYALSSALTLMEQADVTGRRIAVIGDMLELGEQELEFHRDSGRVVPKSVDTVIGVGPRSKALLDGAREAGFDAGKLHHFDDAAAAAEFLKTFIRPGDLVLIKASRGIGLDKVVDALQEEGAH